MKLAKIAVSKLLRHSLYYGGLSRLLCLANRRPRILMFHEVGSAEYSVNLFRAQLTFLQRIFQIVPLQQIWRENASDLTRRPKLALTFDDGLRNNFALAYPILKELDCPATFFVCPGLIASGEWLWNHECRARLACISIDERRRLAKRMGLSPSDGEAIIQKLKYMAHARRVEFEKEIAEVTPTFKPTEQQHRDFDVMSWAELKRLEPDLITIGGHSLSHQILTQLDSEHLEREVAVCKSWLEGELHRPVDHFCYPDGAYDSKVQACVGRHFVSAVTTEKGWVPVQPSLLKLPRISIPSNLPDLAWRMQRPTG